jgi:hypothetical protein
LEGVADVREFGGVGVGERGAQVGDAVEHLEDLLGADAGWAVCLEASGCVLYGGVAAGQLLDALLGCGDDGVDGVVVLLEERLSVDGAFDLLSLAVELLEFLVVCLPVARGGLG